MKKRVSCITPSLKTHRPVLRDVSNQKPTEGQLLALEYNKNRLATLKEQQSIADAKRLEAENELKAEATKRLEAEERAARLEARLAALEGKL
jgi:hypothetical protein